MLPDSAGAGMFGGVDGVRTFEEDFGLETGGID